MNDYAHGALETLAWTLGLLEETEDPGRIRRQQLSVARSLALTSWRANKVWLCMR
jgi:hypothetical protein